MVRAMKKDPNVMRVVSWNLHGAAVPGKSTRQQQLRAWHYLAALGADVILLQEVEWAAIPAFASDLWSSVKGDEIPALADARWGSLIGARADLGLHSRKELFEDLPLRILYGYVVIASVEIPQLGSLVLASVHAPARPVSALVGILKYAAGFDLSSIQHLGLAGLEPWCCDLAFDCLARRVQGQRFVVAGDWNNARLFDTTMPHYNGASVEFFRRCAAREWFECHEAKGEQRSFLKAGSHPYQLDHAFCDLASGGQMLDCSVRIDPVVHEVSDHAPVVTDFRFGSCARSSPAPP
jgi:endonuclease/exonuclease/phosphatase family metal-dependent hydrolase